MYMSFLYTMVNFSPTPRGASTSALAGWSVKDATEAIGAINKRTKKNKGKVNPKDKNKLKLLEEINKLTKEINKITGKIKTAVTKHSTAKTAKAKEKITGELTKLRTERQGVRDKRTALIAKIPVNKRGTAKPAKDKPKAKPKAKPAKAKPAKSKPAKPGKRSEKKK